MIFAIFFLNLSMNAELGINSDMEFYLFDFNRFALNMELRHFVVTQLFIDIKNGEQCKEVDCLRGVACGR